VVQPPDLHADAERWSDNRDDETCPECGGPRVVFIPCAEDGSGLFTVDEIEEIIGRGRMKLLEEWEQTESHGLEPMLIPLPDDIVLQIDGRRDGSFRAVILATGGADGQTYVRYGRGSDLLGAVGWRHGLAVSRFTSLDTTEEEAAEGLIAYEGPPGILNFTRRAPYVRGQEEAQELFRMERAARDRTSRTTAWSRHVKQDPGSSFEDPGSDSVTPTRDPPR
jgi:hypothetical protein